MLWRKSDKREACELYIRLCRNLCRLITVIYIFKYIFITRSRLGVYECYNASLSHNLWYNQKKLLLLIMQTVIFCRINVTHLIYTASHLFRRAIKNFTQNLHKGFCTEISGKNLWSLSKNKFTNLSSLVYLESKALAGTAYSQINPDSTLQRNKDVLRLMQTMVVMFCRIITFFVFFYFTILHISLFPFIISYTERIFRYILLQNSLQISSCLVISSNNLSDSIDDNRNFWNIKWHFINYIIKIIKQSELF